MISKFGRKYIQNFSTNCKGEYAILGTVTGVNLAVDYGGLCVFKAFGTDWEGKANSGTLPNIPCAYNVGQLRAHKKQRLI